MGWSTSWWTAPPPSSMPGVRAIELERRRLDAELAATAGEIERRGSHLDERVPPDHRVPAGDL